MRGSCWVHIKYIDYYEQFTCFTWLTLLKARKQSTGLTGLCSQEDRQECLPYPKAGMPSNACR